MKMLSNQFRRLSFEHGEITRAELAFQVGCTHQSINAIEAAKYGSSLGLAFIIAEEFGVGLEQVFQYGDVNG